MACSKYEYELGYEENRFEIVVSQRFHCPICLLVLKDPVMCKNEHYYCSFCIKKHLENSSFCPTCLEHLTVDTLRPAPRIVKDYISELNIHCDFNSRGCPEMVQDGNLKRHVASCGFSPVRCSNDGCNVLLNARDKLHHETEVCDFRKVQSHDCGQLKNEVKQMRDEMLAGHDKVKNEIRGMIENEMKGVKAEMNEMKEGIKGMKEEVKGEIKNEMKEGMKGMIDQVLVRQDQMQSKIVKEMKEEVKNQMKNEFGDMKVEIKNEMKGMIENEMKGMIENEMKGMKEEVKSQIKGEVNKMKEEMINEMKEIVMNAVRDAMAGIKDLEVDGKNSKQSSQAARSSDARENIFLVGGQKRQNGWVVDNKSTECFNWADQTWTLLNSAVFEGSSTRSFLCSFLYQGQMVVAGGNKTNTLKCLNVSDPAATWKDFAVNLPVKCSSNKVVNHNDLLFMLGEWVQTTDGASTRSDAVYEVKLVPPYSSKMLTRLPQPRSYYGMEMFDQKLFILGRHDEQITTSVVQYDLIKNECKEMPPLPYAVQYMATVLWRNNVLMIGGLDEDYKHLNTVVMYDVITGRSQMLASMKQKRYGCTAVVTGNIVVVMGGSNEKGEYLKSVECFHLERQVWQDLPDMLEPRGFATAVVKPNH